MPGNTWIVAAGEAAFAARWRLGAVEEAGGQKLAGVTKKRSGFSCTVPSPAASTLSATRSARVASSVTVALAVSASPSKTLGGDWRATSVVLALRCTTAATGTVRVSGLLLVKMLPERMIELAATPVVPSMGTPDESVLGWMFRPTKYVTPAAGATSL